MNNLRNSVRLIGHLGGAPEVKTIDNGNKMARVSIATNETYTDKKGEKQQENNMAQSGCLGKDRRAGRATPE